MESKFKDIDHIHLIKSQLKIGQLTYDEAKAQCLPYIKSMEEKAAVIAKELGKTPPKFSFSKLMR